MTPDIYKVRCKESGDDCINKYRTRVIQSDYCKGRVGHIQIGFERYLRPNIFFIKIQHLLTHLNTKFKSIYIFISFFVILTLPNEK